MVGYASHRCHQPSPYFPHLYSLLVHSSHPFPSFYFFPFIFFFLSTRGERHRTRRGHESVIQSEIFLSCLLIYRKINLSHPRHLITVASRPQLAPGILVRNKPFKFRLWVWIPPELIHFVKRVIHMVKNKGFRSSNTRDELGVFLLMALWTWKTHIASLCLSLLICNMGQYLSRFGLSIEWDNEQKAIFCS